MNSLINTWKGFYSRGETDYILIPDYSFKCQPVRLVDINRTPEDILLKKSIGAITNEGKFFTKEPMKEGDFFVLKNTRGPHLDFFKKLVSGELKGKNLIYHITTEINNPEEFTDLIGGLSACITLIEPQVLIIKFDENIFEMKPITNYLSKLNKSMDLYLFPRLDVLIQNIDKLKEWNMCISNITLKVFPEYAKRLIGKENILIFVEGVKKMNKFFFKTQYSESEMKIEEEDFDILNEFPNIIFLVTIQDQEIFKKQTSSWLIK